MTGRLEWLRHPERGVGGWRPLQAWLEESSQRARVVVMDITGVPSVTPRSPTTWSRPWTPPA